jgi:hypothetical protein
VREIADWTLSVWRYGEDVELEAYKLADSFGDDFEHPSGVAVCKRGACRKWGLLPPVPTATPQATATPQGATPAATRSDFWQG